MIIHTPRTKFSVAVDLEKDERFDIQVFGEPRTVDQFKAILNNDGDKVDIACHLLGRRPYSKSFTVLPEALPGHIWLDVKQAYRAWVETLPGDLDGFCVEGKGTTTHQPPRVDTDLFVYGEDAASGDDWLLERIESDEIPAERVAYWKQGDNAHPYDNVRVVRRVVTTTFEDVKS